MEGGNKAGCIFTRASHDFNSAAFWEVYGENQHDDIIKAVFLL